LTAKEVLNDTYNFRKFLHPKWNGRNQNNDINAIFKKEIHLKLNISPMNTIAAPHKIFKNMLFLVDHLSPFIFP